MLHRSIVTHAQAWRIALRAQWKALTRRACRGKNAETFLNIIYAFDITRSAEQYQQAALRFLHAPLQPGVCRL